MRNDEISAKVECNSKNNSWLVSNFFYTDFAAGYLRNHVSRFRKKNKNLEKSKNFARKLLYAKSYENVKAH